MSTTTLSIPLARHLLDRDADARSRPELLDDLLRDARTRVLPFWKGRALLAERIDGSEPALALLAPGDLPETLYAIYLGRAEGDAAPLVVAVLDDAAAAALEPEALRWQALRTATETLSDAEAARVAQVAAIVNWHDSHLFCPRCGTATIVQQAGWVRHCPNDRSDVFPRTDPAVIVLITDADDRVLLGSNASWQPGRYSLLAGFVEPGESLEHAVIREMKEESGLSVVDPVYRGSQPWPFPSSIMLGFSATLAPGQAPGDLHPDGAEIIDLRWFSRDDVRAAREGVILPGRASIARAMLEDWFGGPIGDGEVRW